MVMLALPFAILSCTTSSIADEDTTGYYCSIVKFGITSINRRYYITTPQGRDSSYVAAFVTTGYNFVIDHVGNDQDPFLTYNNDSLSYGFIYNRDSLPYGCIPRAVTAISYTGANLFYRRHDAWPNEEWTNYSTKDTIPYSEPIDFRVTARNGDTRTYTMKLNIHTQDGEKWNWMVMDSLPKDLTEKKLATLGNTVLLYGKDGDMPTLMVHELASGTWQEKTLTGLTSTVDFSTMCTNDMGLFVNDAQGNVFRSMTGEIWTQMPGKVSRLLAASHKKLYAIKDGSPVKCDIKTGEWESDALDDMGSLEMMEKLKYANSLFIEQQDSIDRVLLVGCYTESTPVDTVAHSWAKAWFTGDEVDTEDYCPWNYYPITWTNTAKLPALEHLCVLNYNGEQLAFGGRKIGSEEDHTGFVYVSKDRGLTWRNDNNLSFPYLHNYEVVAASTSDHHIWLVQGKRVLKGRQYKLGFE